LRVEFVGMTAEERIRAAMAAAPPELRLML